MDARFFIGIVFVLTFLPAFSQRSWTDEEAQLIQQVEKYKSQNLDTLKTAVDELLSQAELNGNSSLKNLALLRLAESFILFNYHDHADSVFDLIMPLQLADLQQVELALAKGKVLDKRGEADLALEVYYNALDLSREQNFEKVIPEIYTEIGIVLRRNNDLENTTKYFRFAIEEAEKQKNIELLVRVCNLMCKVYNGWLVVDLDSSVHYGEKAIDVAREHNYEYGYVEAITTAAAPLIRSGEYRRGLEMSREALSYVDKFNTSLQMRYYLILNLGFAYRELGLYDSAMHYMRTSEILRPIGYDHFRLEYMIYKSQGQFRDALEALEVYRLKSDSSLRWRSRTRLSSLQARYEANVKEQEVISLTQKAELQELQLTQQRFIFAGIVLLALLVGGGGVLLYRQRQLKQKQELTNLELEETQKRLELEQQYRASELKAIRSQMNPHFVFNALNSIQEYIMSNERKLAGKYLGKFADLMRIYLEHSQVKSITLREEIEALKLYLELEKLRFEDSMQYNIEVGDEIDEETVIPSLLLQPYVENAIKHGLLHKESDRELLISIRKIGNTEALECEVLDNGVGRTRSQEINKMRNGGHRSFATQATKSRLELLNHDRNLPIQEEIIDLQDEHGEPIGTKVLIRIPVDEALEVESSNSEIR